MLVAARINQDSASTELKKELAVHLFEKKLLTLGKAAEFAGLSRWDFMDILGSRKILLHYSVDEWEADKTILEELTG